MTHSFSSPHKTPAPSRDDILSPSWQWLSWWQWNWRKILIWNCHFVPRIKNTVYLKSSSNKHPSQLLPENFLCFLFSFLDAAAALGGHCAICVNVCLSFLITLFQTALGKLSLKKNILLLTFVNKDFNPPPLIIDEKPLRFGGPVRGVPPPPL